MVNVILYASPQSHIHSKERDTHWTQGKRQFFCIRYFSKTKRKLAGKNTGQCLLTELKPTC